jgi:hypothetical protein
VSIGKQVSTWRAPHDNIAEVKYGKGEFGEVPIPKFKDGDFVKDSKGSTYKVVESRTWGITVQNVATKVAKIVLTVGLGAFTHTPPPVTYYNGSEDTKT